MLHFQFLKSPVNPYQTFTLLAVAFKSNENQDVSHVRELEGSPVKESNQNERQHSRKSHSGNNDDF